MQSKQQDQDQQAQSIKVPSLISITSEMQEIYNQIAEQGGEITEDQDNKLSMLLLESKDKVTGYCVVLDRLESEKSYIKQEIQRLREYEQKLDVVQARLENIAKQVVTTSGKLEGNAGRWINLRKSEQVVIETDDVEQIPFEYLRVKYEMDKTKIKQGLKDGQEIPFCRLQTNYNLSWK
jgi:hypothetical protein